MILPATVKPFLKGFWCTIALYCSTFIDIMNSCSILVVLSLCLAVSPYSSYASEKWDTLASHINTNVAPDELMQEVNDVLHQTFDQATQKKK